MKAKEKQEAGLGAGGAAPQIGRQAARSRSPNKKAKGAARQAQNNPAPAAASLSSKKNKTESSRSRGSYKAYDYEDAYTQQLEKLKGTEQEAFVRKLIDQQRRAVYATKRVTAGTQMDVEVYPEFTHLPGWTKRERDPAAQRSLNDRNSRKECARRVNENFDALKDIWLTLTFFDRCLPDSYEAAKKEFVKWVRRVNYARKKKGLPPARYVYWIDWTKNGKRVRCHVHVTIDGALPEADLLKLWPLGKRSKSSRLYKDEHGLNGLAYYGTKPHTPDTEDFKSKKKWASSKGLRPPQERKNHQDFRRRKVEKLAEQPGAIAAEMEVKYPKYWCEAAEARWNGHVGLFYLRAEMRERAQAGDLVTISGREDALKDISPQIVKKLLNAYTKADTLRVLSVDYTVKGWETAILELPGGRDRVAIPARACIIADKEGRVKDG